MICVAIFYKNKNKKNKND